MSTELTADGQAIRSYNEAHAHPTYADYVWLDRAKEIAKERDEARAELERKSPLYVKGDCCDRVCQSLSIEGDIIGHVRRLQAELASARAEAATRQERLSMALLAAEAESARLRQAVVKARWGLEAVCGCSALQFACSQCLDQGKRALVVIDAALAPPAQPAAAPAATEPPRDTSAWRECLTHAPGECDGSGPACAVKHFTAAAWRECVRQEVAGGTYDLVPEPDNVITALQRLLDVVAKMAEEPWHVQEWADNRKLYDVLDKRRNSVTDCALEEDANGIAALRNCARPLLEALIALQAERHLRLNVDDDPQFFDRLYALQEASDAALRRLADALEVQP